MERPTEDTVGMRNLANGLDCIILHLDTDAKVTFCNDFAREFFRECRPGMPIADVVPVGTKCGLTRLLAALATAPTARVVDECAMVRADGEQAWVAWTVKGTADDEGRLESILCFGADMTQRRRAEEQLRRSEAQLRAMLDTIPDLVFRFDADGVCLDFHTVSNDLLMTPPDAIVGKRIDDIGLPDDVAAQALGAIEQTPAIGDVQTFEYELELPNGTGYFEARIVGCDDGEALAIIRDIGERREYELRQERLIAELQTALADVRQLEGLLPICASCKKVRDDAGYWNQIEEFISSRSGVEFTHGLCPECGDVARAELSANGPDSPPAEF